MKTSIAISDLGFNLITIHINFTTKNQDNKLYYIRYRSPRYKNQKSIQWWNNDTTIFLQTEELLKFPEIAKPIIYNIDLINGTYEELSKKLKELNKQYYLVYLEE